MIRSSYSIVTDTINIYDCLSKNLHSLHQNCIQFYCHSLQTHTVAIYPSPVYQVLKFNANWSIFLKGILLTLQSHDWININGTKGGCQLGSGDLGLFLLTLWPTIVSLATVWASWLLMGCPKWGFLLPPAPPTLRHPLHPAVHPIHPLYKQYLC